MIAAKTTYFAKKSKNDEIEAKYIFLESIVLDNIIIDNGHVAIRESERQGSTFNFYVTAYEVAL